MEYHLTFKEHLFLLEARKADTKYTEKQVKNVLDRVTAELGGSDAASMTKLAKRYVQLDTRMKIIKEQHAKLNDQVKGLVEDFFDPEDLVMTRVVETAQFTLTMAKAVKKPDGQEKDYEKIIEGLTNLVAKELQPQVEMIIEKYTSVVPAKEPAKTLKVAQKLKLDEGILDSVERAKKWVAGLLKKVTSWATRYDAKLAALKLRAGKD